MPAFDQTPADLSIAMIPGDELNVKLTFTTASGNTTVPLNLTGYTFEAKVFIPQFGNSDGGLGSGSYTVGATAATPTVSAVNLSAGQISIGLTETQTSALSPATGYRWFLKWVAPGSVTLTVLSGTFTARLP